MSIALLLPVGRSIAGFRADLCLWQRLQWGYLLSPLCPTSSPLGHLSPWSSLGIPGFHRHLSQIHHRWMGFGGGLALRPVGNGEGTCTYSSPPSPPAGFWGRSEARISSQHSSCKIRRKRMLGGCLYPLRAAGGSCPTAARQHRIGRLHYHLAHVRRRGALQIYLGGY